MPENNQLKLKRTGEIISYDFLVVCSGVELRYDLIPGSEQALQDDDCPVGSMYKLEYAKKMSRLRESFKKGKAIFTLPQMPVKCGGAPQKIMYLSEQTWRNNGVRKDIDIQWYTSVGVMFPVKKYGDSLKQIAQSKNINLNFMHLIKSVDGANRTVTFTNTQANEEVKTEFDLLHVVPPQTPHQFIRESSLTTTGNFVDAKPDTLQSPIYPNVFALGDVAALPTAKTAAAVFSQAPIVVNNLLKLHDGQELDATYDGYSSCPLFTGDEQLMLMEFKYGDIPAETFSDKQDQPNRLFYHLKKDLFPYCYWKFMPKGQWYGRSFYKTPKFYSNSYNNPKQ